MATKFVVRGSHKTLDSNYACAARDVQLGKYAVVEIDSTGTTTRQSTYDASERAALEKELREFRGSVFVDTRKDAGLLPLSHEEHFKPVDLALMRRIKSPEELRELEALHAKTVSCLKGESSSVFRSAEQEMEGWKAAFVQRKGQGFIEYRGGFMTPTGLKSDLTRVVATNADWEERLKRVHRGLDAVEANLKEGATFRGLNEIFMKHMDPEKDAVFGDVVHFTGTEANENAAVGAGPDSTLRENDFVTVGTVVGKVGGRGHAIVYRSALSTRRKPPERSSVFSPSGPPAESIRAMDTLGWSRLPAGQSIQPPRLAQASLDAEAEEQRRAAEEANRAAFTAGQLTDVGQPPRFADLEDPELISREEWGKGRLRSPYPVINDNATRVNVTEAQVQDGYLRDVHTRLGPSLEYMRHHARRRANYQTWTEGWTNRPREEDVESDSESSSSSAEWAEEMQRILNQEEMQSEEE